MKKIEKKLPCCEASYRRGYDLGYKHTERLKIKLLKLKIFIKEAWKILFLMKDNFLLNNKPLKDEAEEKKNKKNKIKK